MMSFETSTLLWCVFGFWRRYNRILLLYLLCVICAFCFPSINMLVLCLLRLLLSYGVCLQMLWWYVIVFYYYLWCFP